MESELTALPVLVIGGGAAGMIAAWRAAGLGARVLLLEKNRRLGLKIHISGGGKCNITHGGEMETIRRAFEPAEARFLRGPFARFSNQDLLRLLTERGVTVHTRPDGRIFPDSGRAEDVTDALEWQIRRAGVEICMGEPVTGLLADEGVCTGVSLRGEALRGGAVVLAPGGCSYPKTGATGDGYAWLRGLRHALVPLRPALAPIYLRRPRPEWSGVALRDCLLRAVLPAGRPVRWRGDLLFTHRGVSGPCALAVSRAAALGMEQGDVSLQVDLVPDIPGEELIRQLTQAHSAGRKGVRQIVLQWVPERLASPLLADAAIPPDRTLHRLERRERGRLVETVKGWPLGKIAEIPLERGEVTAGGVALEDVDPATMQSRLVKGLFLAGEILDIAGPVGGYNLQAAFSTGFVAGEAAGRQSLEQA